MFVQGNRVTTMVPNPFLYILARNDLDSLNPGKLAAQSCHAANMAQTIIAERLNHDLIRKAELQRLWAEWSGDRGFGTTIVLDAPVSTLEKIQNYIHPNIFNWADKRPVIMGVVVDPSYPVSDGKITHLVPLMTCGFIFGDKNHFDVNTITGSMRLFP